MLFRKYVIFLCVCLSGCQANQEEKPVLETRDQKYSYGLGVEMGEGLRLLQVEFPDLDPELVARGLRDALERRELLASQTELKKAKLFTEDMLMEKRVQTHIKNDPEFEALLQKNKEESEAFLGKNRTREGVVVTASGVQYEIIRAGEGKSPKAKDEVLMHLRGTLIDGTEFDNSRKAFGTPVKYRVQHLIRGFSEVIQLMQEGAKWKLYIPSDLAYGKGGREPNIGPNMALVFEVEVVEVIPNQYEYKRK